MTIWSGKLNQPAGRNTKVAPIQKPQPDYAERLENSLVLGLVASLHAPMSGNVGFTIGPATDATGMVVYVRFDNFCYIPEPGSVIMLALGGLGVILQRRAAQA